MRLQPPTRNAGWLLSTLYTTVERRQEWLDLAGHGIRFLRKYGFDDDGRMFFQVTREGRPLRKRRYLFTEAFAVIALSFPSLSGYIITGSSTASKTVWDRRKQYEIPGLSGFGRLFSGG